MVVHTNSQRPTSFDYEVIDECLEQARVALGRGDLPIGAAVVRDGVVTVGVNATQTLADPTMHAELTAIRDASLRVAAAGEPTPGALEGATLYSTLEPCPMCCSAALRVGIDRIVLGADNASLGRRHHGSYTPEGLADMLGRRITVVYGIRANECEVLVREAVDPNCSDPRMEDDARPS